MGKFYSGQVRVYFEFYEVGTATVAGGLMREADVLDTTPFADAERFIPGIRKDAIDWSGYFDDGTSFDAFAAANIGSGTKVISYFIGTATGNIAYGAQAQIFVGNTEERNKAVITASSMLKPDQVLDRGVVLTARTTATGSNISGSVDNVALSTGSAYWYLHVFSIGVGTTSTIALQDSADGANFTDLAIQVISTSTAYRIQVGSGAGGTIREYTRLRWDATGTKSIASMVSRVN